MVPDLCITRWLWKAAAPPKIQFFGWLAWRGRVKTAAFLQRIGVLDGNADILCAFCREEIEIVNYVLLHCPMIWRVRFGILSWWDVRWAIPSSVQTLLQWWAGAKFKKKEMCIWKIVPLILLWSVWKLRNDIVFNRGQANFVDLEEIVKLRLSFWAKSSVAGLHYSIHDFLFNFKQVRLCL